MLLFLRIKTAGRGVAIVLSECERGSKAELSLS